MKRVLPLLFGLLGMALWAQERVAVPFKVFPPDYEVFLGGDRLTYALRGENRLYQLPAGQVRVNLTAPGAFPVGLSLDVKAGVRVETKLEPRVGPLALVGEAPSGKLPRNLAFSTDGTRLFVALQGEPGVDVFEVPSLTKVGRWVPAEGPAAGFSDVVAVGAQMWAFQRDGRLHVFDASNLASEPALVLSPGNSGLTNLGTTVAVANWDNGVVTLVDVATKKPGVRAALPGTLRGFTGAQGTLWGTLFDQGKLVALDAATGRVKSTWNAGKAPRPVAPLGNTVFVGDMGSAQVLVLDGTGRVLRTVGVASNPHQMAVAPNLGLVAVASRGRNNPADYQLAGPEFGKVTLLDARGAVVGSVWGRNQPTGLAFSADGKYLAFTDFLDNNVELYRVVY